MINSQTFSILSINVKIKYFFSRSGRFSLALQELVIRCLALDPGKSKKKKKTSKITANYII